MTTSTHLEGLVLPNQLDLVIADPSELQLRVSQIYLIVGRRCFGVHDKRFRRDEVDLRRYGTPSNRKILLQLLQKLLTDLKHGHPIKFLGYAILQKLLKVLSLAIVQINNIILILLINEVS